MLEVRMRQDHEIDAADLALLQDLQQSLASFRWTAIDKHCLPGR